MGDKPEKEPGAWDACTWSGARRDGAVAQPAGDGRRGGGYEIGQ